MEAVLSEVINSDIGKKDGTLRALAKTALRGGSVIGRHGKLLYENIRDRLLNIGAKGNKRADALAREYNWHRVHDATLIDEATKEFLTNNTRAGKTNERFRRVHNLYGHGMENRGGNLEDQARLLAALRAHIVSKKLGTNGYNMRGDRPLLDSIHRVAQAEENIHNNPSKTGGDIREGRAVDVGHKQASKERKDKPGEYTNRDPRTNRAGQYQRLNSFKFRYAAEEKVKSDEEERDEDGYKDLMCHMGKDKCCEFNVSDEGDYNEQ